MNSWHTLDRKNIYILPTRQGIFFLLLNLLIALVAINYQNSLVFLVAFLLVSLFLTGIFHTHRNLSGLSFRLVSSDEVFASEDAMFRLVVRWPEDRPREQIRIGWREQLMIDTNINSAEQILDLYVPTKRRGRFYPGRLLLETRYPLGLLRAWSRWDSGISTLVYPEPIVTSREPEMESESDDGQILFKEGAGEFYGLRDYQQGDTFRRVDWKSFARSDQLMIKQFASAADNRIWLDWQQLSGMDMETRLGCLCYWIVQYAAKDCLYGLRLPGKEITPGKGRDHTRALLRLLALYGDPGQGDESDSVVSSVD